MGSAIALGLVVALLAQFLAFFMMGAGHGWLQPSSFSPALFIVYPIVFVRLMAPDELPSRALDLLVLAVALVLDVMLVKATQAEGIQYFHRVMALPPLPHLWLLLWLLWQILTMKLIISGLANLRR